MLDSVRVIIPDSHGHHIDKRAAKACLADVRILAPNEIVLLGDHVDAGGLFSRHPPSYVSELEESYSQDVLAAAAFLDDLQRAAPRAKYHYLEGNHEQHVERWAVGQFRRKVDADRFLSGMGPQNALELRSRGIAYYRRSVFYQGLTIPGCIRLGRCFYVHGISHSSNAAAVHLRRFGANVVFGHTHTAQSLISRTVTSSGHGAWCPGTLAELQPLYRHTEPTQHSHGYAVQFISGRTGRFAHFNVPIVNGSSMLHALAKR